MLPRDAKTFLDVGCSDGTLGASIKSGWPGAEVTGLELSPDMGAVAARRLDKVIIGDVEARETIEALGNAKFDAVICADVLEHLRDPWAFVRALAGRMNRGAVLVTSIPNVRHIDTIINLVLLGRWPYRERGIHDRTHLRFFTKGGALDLLKSADLQPRVEFVNYRLIERPHPINRYARMLAVPGVRPFLAFQYLLVARRL